MIRECGARPGIAIDPATPIEAIKHILPDVELACVMTVNPGYTGQRLVPQGLIKVRELAAHARSEGLQIEIEVDGNVSWDNIPRMVEAGANVLVLGTSSIYDGVLDTGASIDRLRDELRHMEAG